ncbi:hypothetical protein EM595_1878 [Duffyella gerundensis]|uniref:Uncharacterized protein n=1 Tax=Duffyella gerundensis TaxID=1619313 RepID=A0A0U5L4L9_9GAMM|nr:hypothetical protein EM595_1878 [Duffyella gerundensis]
MVATASGGADAVVYSLVQITDPLDNRVSPQHGRAEKSQDGEAVK